MAHCFVSNNKAANILALVGDQDTDIGTETPFSAIYSIEVIIIHASYIATSATNAHDIALLRTVNNIRFNRGRTFKLFKI